MQFHIDILQTTRNNIIRISDQFDIDQLNTIPNRYNNNLAWNLGHILVTQQLLFYGLSGNDIYLPKEMISRYRKGSRPDETIPSEEIDYIKENLGYSIEKFIEDHKNGIFTNFKEYPTSYGITLRSLEEAIIFNNAHEACI